MDASIESNPIGEMIQLLSVCRNRDLVQKYGLWLAEHEPVSAFTVSRLDVHLLFVFVGGAVFDVGLVLIVLAFHLPTSRSEARCHEAG